MKTPVLNYPGSKFAAAKFIISKIPADHVGSTEGFGGTAHVLLQKKRSKIEIYNDKAHGVTNFFQVLRDHTDELVRLVELTPWSAEEHALCLLPTSDPVEAARRFYFRCWSSIQPFSSSPGFRRQKKVESGQTSAAMKFMRTDHLFGVAERLRGVVIEPCLDAKVFYQTYNQPNFFHYVDPPFFVETRRNKSQDLYEIEMKEEQEHRDLAKTLHNLNGFVLLNGYSCDLYAELYEQQGWTRVDEPIRVNGGRQRVESVWLNPRLATQLSIGVQINLF